LVSRPPRTGLSDQLADASVSWVSTSVSAWKAPCTSLATTTPALAGKGGSSLLGAESDGEDAGGGKAEQKQQNE